MKLIHTIVLWQIVLMNYYVQSADDEYNTVHNDGSFEFGYNNPDSYHFANGDRNNVVRGVFGGRSPKTGRLDKVEYTAGPRGYRPRGSNVVRNFDFNQNGPPPLGSPDDPFYDPFEDKSYKFGFKTSTYSRNEQSNRVGDVTGKFTYLDDVGESHNLEFIAGKRTGFHVKTPFPDSSPPAGNYYIRGRGRPGNRGKTSIQRGLDGSYKFVSSGPDQRRTEVSDATGHVRGSYTYIDDKGDQHSVHYIAGPETGYRVLKTVKGPHLPTVYPFEPQPGFTYFDDGEVFTPEESGRPVRPLGGRPGGKFPKPTSTASSFDNGIDEEAGGDDAGDGGGDEDIFGGGNDDVSPSKPSFTTTRKPIGRPTVTTFKPSIKPPIPQEDDGEGGDDDVNSGGESSTFPGYPLGKPTATSSNDYDNSDEYNGGSAGSRPSGGSRPGTYGSGGGSRPGFPGDSSGSRPGSYGGSSSSFQGSSSSGNKRPCPTCKGTLVTNIGKKPFNVPPGVSVRAHVQSIDLYGADDVSFSESLREKPKNQEVDSETTKSPKKKEAKNSKGRN